jgi:hypothetical protein
MKSPEPALTIGRSLPGHRRGERRIRADRDRPLANRYHWHRAPLGASGASTLAFD